MDYIIMSDMSLDIDQEFARTHDIRYVAMEYMLGDMLYHCEQPQDDDQMHLYYDELRKRVPTKTSQITPNLYIEAFTPLLKEGRSILYLSLSSGLSSTYESAHLAAMQLQEAFPDISIEIVDSLGATGGQGLLVEKAFENRQAGMNLEENAAWLREHAKNVNFWFKVQDLMYLSRGGRISTTSAVLGTALNIKPILKINAQGKLETVAKKRGDKQAFRYMLDRFKEEYDPQYGDLVYISCADCIEEAKRVKAVLLQENPDLRVRITMLSPIIGAHTGPDMLAIIYMGSRRQ